MSYVNGWASIKTYLQKKPSAKISFVTTREIKSSVTLKHVWLKIKSASIYNLLIMVHLPVCPARADGKECGG